MTSIRSLWTRKLSGGTAVQANRKTPKQRTPRSQVIEGFVLGVDPSVRATGISVIQCFPDRSLRLVFSQTVAVSRKLSFVHALGEIHRAMETVLSRWPFVRVGVETTVYVQNFRTMQLLGCARGAALGPASARGVEIFELAPKTIKRCVTGSGTSEKTAVQSCVSAILCCEPLPLDESDASAAAIGAALGISED